VKVKFTGSFTEAIMKLKLSLNAGQWSLVVLLCLALGFSGICVFQLLSFYTSRRLYILLLSIFVSGVLFFILPTKRARARGFVLLILCWLISIEGFLQLTAFFGVLPGINISYPIPFSRVYWIKEGYSNEIRNKRGFHYPKSEFNTDSHRIALIGDSFVEAVQVPAKENLGILLEEELSRSNSKKHEVLSFGQSGYGPAHYLEILKLIQRDYRPNEVVLLYYFGNDYRNLLPEVQETPANDFIYYTVNKGGTDFDIHPESLPVLEYFQQSWSRYHKQPLLDLPRILQTHVFSYHVFQALPVMLEKYRNREEALENPVTRGIGDFIFHDPPNELSKRAFLLDSLILKKMSKFCQEHQIRLRLVTLPFLPKIFYQNPRKDWDLKYKDFDYLLPERELLKKGRSLGFDVLAMGEQWKSENLSPEEIQKMFFVAGQGHLTPLGHRYFSLALSKRISADSH
jgi:hypothetical protein